MAHANSAQAEYDFSVTQVGLKKCCRNDLTKTVDGQNDIDEPALGDISIQAGNRLDRYGPGLAADGIANSNRFG